MIRSATYKSIHLIMIKDFQENVPEMTKFMWARGESAA